MQSTRCSPAGCVLETLRGQLCGELKTDTLTARLREIVKARQEHLDKMSWVRGSL